MDIYRCIPNDGITNDNGADPNATGNIEFYIKESALENNTIPKNCLSLVKKYLANNQVDKLSKPVKVKKLNDIQKAFPLEDTTSFWKRMLKSNDSQKESNGEETSFHTSYISFSVKKSLENKEEVRYIII